MAASTHTPGPWRVVSGDDYRIEADAYPAEFPHHCKEDDTGPYLAYLGTAGNRPDDFGLANARLIAAAPDLLEALKQVMGWIDGWDPNFIHDDEWPETKHHIEAAIAKAEGVDDRAARGEV